MRIVKEAEERKNEILDAAEKLFAQKGFDGTSTNDILNEVKIARGTLYYHFKSKEDILDAMIERLTNRLLKRASEVAVKREIPVLQRITLVIMSLNVENDLGEEIKNQMHRPQNALLHQKMQKQLLAGADPLIANLIREGIDQGICETKYPDDTVEMIMLYSNDAFDDLQECSKEKRKGKIDAFVYNMERLLGMSQGSLQEYILPIFEKDLAENPC